MVICFDKSDIQFHIYKTRVLLGRTGGLLLPSSLLNVRQELFKQVTGLVELKELGCML